MRSLYSPAQLISDVAENAPRGVSTNVVGALFNAASKTGQIRMVGFTRSGRIVGHGNRLVSWIGVSR